jgi:asparaginyl-tRNA synthetase
MKNITTGSCLRVTGNLVESLGSGQPVEIQATEIELYGSADPNVYPLQKKGHSMEFLREIAHCGHAPTPLARPPSPPCHVVCNS